MGLEGIESSLYMGYQTPGQTTAKTDETVAVASEMTQEKQQVVAEAVQPEKQVSAEEVIQAIEKANDKFKIHNTSLEFSIHDKTHAIMVKVIRDDEVIREIPSEKILDMLAQTLEMSGLLVDEWA